MSGPKASRYTLTEEQRQILEEIRKIELRKAIACGNIKNSTKRLNHFENMFKSNEKLSSELILRFKNDGGFFDNQNELLKITSSFDNIHIDTNDLEMLEKTSVEIGKAVSKAKEIIDKLSAIVINNENKLKKSLQSDMDKGLEFSFADIDKNIEPDDDILLDKIQFDLSNMKNEINLPKDYIVEIEQSLEKSNSITDNNYLKNFYSVSIIPLIKKCKLFLEDYEKHYAEFEKVYTEYNSICELNYYIPQKFSFSIGSIKLIREEIERRNCEISENAEKVYIAECLNEVMSDMGYDVIGTRNYTKKNGKHFKNELYTYGEGTAVNVTYSPDGQIAMELGGIDTSDRLPNTRETTTLCNEMNEFCNDFKDIEKRLIKKGVVLANRISLLPPNEEFAQIINTVDYDMNKEIQKMNVSKEHREKSKSKTIKSEM